MFCRNVTREGKKPASPTDIWPKLAIHGPAKTLKATLDIAEVAGIDVAVRNAVELYVIRVPIWPRGATKVLRKRPRVANICFTPFLYALAPPLGKETQAIFLVLKVIVLTYYRRYQL